MSRSDESPRVNFRAFQAEGGRVNIWDRKASDWVFPEPIDPLTARRWAEDLMKRWAAARIDALFADPSSPEEFVAQDAFRRDLHCRQD